MKFIYIFILLYLTAIFSSCSNSSTPAKKPVEVGAHQFDAYIPLLKNKKVGLVANHTSLVQKTHLLDTLLNLGISVSKIFSPEHGFRGDAEAGELINNTIDEKTGVPIISLYGKNYKPKNSDLSDIEILVFDIQDVGVRFYTYISTMHYILEGCAENNIPLIVLDRPNPNGFYVAGPILDTTFSSFVGIHPIPLVHGLTIGELAMMINGEKWIAAKCDLTVIKCKNYTHDLLYELPINPSPNLPNMQAVYLYASLGLFEGTIMSVGRGTEFPFQVYGHPQFDTTLFYFIPQSVPGVSTNPKYNNQKCFGYDLRELKLNKKFTLSFLINAYNNCAENEQFFNSFFHKLAGTKELQKQIESGMTEEEILKVGK